MIGHEQVASKRCKIEVHAFPHGSEKNQQLLFVNVGKSLAQKITMLYLYTSHQLVNSAKRFSK